MLSKRTDVMCGNCFDGYPPCLPVCISVSANGIMHKHLHSVLMLRWDSANLLCFVGFGLVSRSPQ